MDRNPKIGIKAHETKEKESRTRYQRDKLKGLKQSNGINGKEQNQRESIKGNQTKGIKQRESNNGKGTTRKVTKWKEPKEMNHRKGNKGMERKQMDRVKGNQGLKDIEGIRYDPLSYILLCCLCL